MKIDVVYIIGDRSIWGHNEIRFSLRSVEKYLKGNVGNVVICGYLPTFIDHDKVIHIPAEDITDIPDKNIAHKLLVASKSDKVSDTFLYMQDDVFLTEDIEIEKVPYISKGEIHLNREDRYGQMLVYTHDLFKRLGLQNENFDHHYPLLIEKAKLIEAFASFDWFESPFGILTKTMYCTYNEVEFERLSDNKIFSLTGYDEMINYVRNRWSISTTDAVVRTKMFVKWVLEEYPFRSKFETDFIDLLETGSGERKIKTTERNRHHENGTILNVAHSVADILVKKGFAVYV